MPEQASIMLKLPIILFYNYCNNFIWIIIMSEPESKFTEEEFRNITKNFCTADGYATQSLDTAVPVIVNLMQEVRYWKYFAGKYQRELAKSRAELEGLRGV